VNPARRLSGHGRLGFSRAGEGGHVLVEMLAVVSVVILVGGMAASGFTNQRDSIHAAAAARHLGTMTYLVRAEALKRGTHVGLVFRTDAGEYRFATFEDGDGDGLRTADVAEGTDRQVTSWSRLDDDFPRATLGIVPGATDPESGEPLSGSPLRFGGSGMLSFGPDGTATSGTLYLRGPGRQQYALRILGATGRTRVLRFDFEERRWVAP